MRKAFRLLSVLMIFCFALAAVPAYAAAAPDAPQPGPVPAGTTYTVAAGSAGEALTVVDFQLDGGDGAEYGVLYADGGSRYYYGAVISGVTYGAVIDSAGTGYFGSSDGTIPLYDPRGAMTGIVWGDCRATDIRCGTGFLLRGDVTGCILVEDGTTVTALDAVVRYEGGNSRMCFNNARLGTDSGIFLDMAEDAAGQLSLSFTNGSYDGDMNVPAPDAALSVLVGKGALLRGSVLLPEQGGASVELTAAAGATWAPDTVCGLTRLQVEEGASVYARIEDDSGVLTLYPDGEALDPGVYEAVPLPEQPIIESIPFGHGPAVEAEDEASPSDAVPAQTPLTDELPFGHGPAVEAEDEASPSDAVAASDALGLSLARQIAQSALPTSVAGDALADGLQIHLATRNFTQPPVRAAVQIAVTKSESFVLETLDNRFKILYNPYCCLAA